MKSKIHHGIYDALLDQSLLDILSRNPELRTVPGKIDREEQPARYAAFVAKIVEQSLRGKLIRKNGWSRATTSSRPPAPSSSMRT